MTFSTPNYLKQRTGKWGTPRPEYLQQLVTEFSDTDDQEAKEQILANLANFAYDPINYDTLFELHVPDLFIDALDEPNPKFFEFAIAGICNCCLDPRMADIFTQPDNLKLILQGLSSTNEEVVLNTIATLYFLVTPRTYSQIITDPTVECISRYAQAKSVRLRNIATVFLQDFAPHTLPPSTESSNPHLIRQILTTSHTHNNNNNNNNNNNSNNVIQSQNPQQQQQPDHPTPS